MNGHETINNLIRIAAKRSWKMVVDEGYQQYLASEPLICAKDIVFVLVEQTRELTTIYFQNGSCQPITRKDAELIVEFGRG